MKTVLIFLADGYADWEPALIAAELNKPEHGITIKTIAVHAQSVKSMGGFAVLPDYGMDAPVFQENDIAMLIIPGGTGWQTPDNQKVTDLINICRDKSIPVAAICDAVTFLANCGYLDTIRHTGNSLAYINYMAPQYKGQDNFVETQCVADGGFITANGSGHTEFAREILRTLHVRPNVEYAKAILQARNIDPADAVAGWYALWKQGFYTE